MCFFSMFKAQCRIDFLNFPKENFPKKKKQNLYHMIDFFFFEVKNFRVEENYKKMFKLDLIRLRLHHTTSITKSLNYKQNS